LKRSGRRRPGSGGQLFPDDDPHTVTILQFEDDQPKKEEEAANY